MINMKKLSFVTMTVAFVFTAGLAVHSFAKSSDFTDQKVASSSQMEELQNRVGTIYNEYGVFYRVEDKNSIPSSDTAYTVYDDKDVTSSTKLIVMDSGTFVKGKE